MVKMTEHILSLHLVPGTEQFRLGVTFLEKLRESSFGDFVKVLTRLYTKSYTGFFSLRFHRVFLSGLEKGNLSMDELRPLFSPSIPIQTEELTLVRRQRQIDVMTMYNSMIEYVGKSFDKLFVEKQQEYLETLNVPHDASMTHLVTGIIFVPVPNKDGTRRVVGKTLRDILTDTPDIARLKYTKEWVMWQE